MSYTVNISLPKTLAKKAQEEVKKGYYVSLSEIIRAALRQFLLKSQVEIPTFEMSTKTEKTALKALKDYEAGKTTSLKTPEDLGNL